MHIEAAQETTAFRYSHHQAYRAWAAGDRTATFPYGTYQMRVRHAAHVAEPPEMGGGIVCRPGPLLCDVSAELDAERERRRALGQTRDDHDRFALMEETTC